MTAIDRVMDTNNVPLTPAELMALIISNFSDCRHVKLFCNDPRYATLCAQHNVYNRFVANRWHLPPLTQQQFDIECEYYTQFLTSQNSVAPSLYEHRMQFVLFIEDFVGTNFDIVISPQHGLNGNVGLQQEGFANRMVDMLEDAMQQYTNIDANIEFKKVPQSDDDDEVLVQENGAPQNVADYDDGFHFMVTSVHDVNDHEQQTMVHHISPEDVRYCFHQNRRQTIKETTSYIVNNIGIGIRNWRTYMMQTGAQIPNVNEELWMF